MDGNAKSGGIDLLVETTTPQVNRASIASKIMASLQIQLGGQNIDVVLAGPVTPFQLIHEYARKQGAIL